MNPQLMTNPPIKQQAPNLGIRSFMNLFLKNPSKFFHLGIFVPDRLLKVHSIANFSIDMPRMMKRV
ncbi:hypothetical protein PcaKH35_11600 [Parageobacillus caldoxylosilyticus]|jgi:hypothetical protein|nr:hypothetical protein PcaKH35_11600 [Parageobacillus caldoxylosilyticus]